MNKKFTLMLASIAFSTISFAQLKVDSQGQTFTSNKLYVNNNYYRLYTTSGAGYIANQGPAGIRMDQYGYVGMGDFSLQPTTGMFGGVLTLYPGTAQGLLVTSASTNYTPAPLLELSTPVSSKVAFRSSLGSTPTFVIYGNGNTTIQGNITYYGTLQYSDLNLKMNIETVSNSLSKVLQLRGVSFDYKPQTDAKQQAIDEAAEAEVAKEIDPDVWQQIKAEKTRKHIGVIAQEVEKVAPEVVRTLQDGKKAVAYPEMIGLLIEAVKEQQNQIEELKAELKAELNNPLRSPGLTTETTGITNVALAQCKLYQNAPNPFSQTTQIKVYVPDNIKSAYLTVYDLQGKQLKQIAITQKGESAITISGSEFPAGIYLYALIADGQKVDVKQMILTEYEVCYEKNI